MIEKLVNHVDYWMTETAKAKAELLIVTAKRDQLQVTIDVAKPFLKADRDELAALREEVQHLRQASEIMTEALAGIQEVIDVSDSPRLSYIYTVALSAIERAKPWKFMNIMREKTAAQKADEALDSLG